MNLNQVIQSAFSNNTDLKIVASELRMGQLDNQQEASAFKPQVKAYGKYHWYWADQPELIFPAAEGSVLSGGTSDGPYPVHTGQPNNLAMGMNVEQRIYDQRFFLAKEGNEIFTSLSEKRMQVSKDELAYEIAKNYFELNELQSRENALLFNKKRLEKAIRIITIQVQNDMTPATDLEKAKLRLQKLEIGHTRLENGVRQKLAYIMMMAGIVNNDSITIVPAATDTVPGMLLLGNDSTHRTPAIELLETMQQSNLLKLEFLKAGHLPSIDFFADVQWYSQSDNLSFFENNAINNQSFLGLKLDIPIYSGDLFKKQKQKAGIQNEIYRMQQHKIAEGQILQIERYKQELDALHKEWDIQQQLEAIAAKQLSQAESKFEKGTININDLFLAEEEVLNAGKEKNELLLKIKTTELDILKASGQLQILYK